MELNLEDSHRYRSRNEDASKIKPWHLVSRVCHDVPDNFHRRSWWIDEGVADHELLQNVVLDRPLDSSFNAAIATKEHLSTSQLFARNSRFFCRSHEHREDWDHGTIHGHRHGDLKGNCR